MVKVLFKLLVNLLTFGVPYTVGRFAARKRMAKEAATSYETKSQVDESVENSSDNVVKQDLRKWVKPSRKGK